MQGRDWLVAWLWLNFPDHRPTDGQVRGLPPLEHSATVDPLDAISDEHVAPLRDPALLFANVPRGLATGAYIGFRNRQEYALLVIRQLRPNKVELSRIIRAWASIFAVGKGSGG